ncbi:MAG: response regulator transcription factor [Flavobacteriales bacterium]
MDGPLAIEQEHAPHLTPRELEVLRLMCHPECWMEKELPERIGVSLGTFKNHKEKVFKKCNVGSRLQLVVKAVRWKLVECYCVGAHAHGSTTAQPGDAPANPGSDAGSGQFPPLLAVPLWCGIVFKLVELLYELSGMLSAMEELVS